MTRYNVMYGDLVQLCTEKKPFKITEIYPDSIVSGNTCFDYSIIEPVPISKELLTINGFEKSNTTEETYHYYGNSFSAFYCFDTKIVLVMDETNSENVLTKEIEYMHELQHLIRIFYEFFDFKLI